MSQSPEKTFGQNLCRIRTEKRLTQEQLAEKADSSRRYIQLLEAGTHSPSLNVLSRVRKGLDIPWEDLLKSV